MAIVLLTNLVKVPFHHFFQAVAVQAFVSAAIGSAIGSAILHHIFKFVTTKNFQLISSNIDRVNYNLFREGNKHLDIILQNQILMVSFKEVYGYLIIAGIICFIAFLFYNYPYLPKNVLYPKMRSIRKM